MSMSLNLGGLSLGSSFKLGAKSHTKPDENTLYDLLIIGGGPAAMNAALYGARKGLKLGLIAKRMGGQLLDTSEVDNYLGVMSVSGEGLAEVFKQHMEASDVPWLEDEVKEVIETEEGFKLLTGDLRSFRAKTVLLATGSKPRTLGVPGEADFSGKGVAYCAICDGPLYKGKKVIVAGGGNSAVEAALDLSKLARDVVLVHRSQLRADEVLVRELYKQPNVEIRLETQIQQVLGENSFTGVEVITKDGGRSLLEADGLFVEIGHVPNLGPFKGKLAVNDHGEVCINEQHETSVKGVFAAGDITPEPFKQIVVAAADGAKAALAINQYLHVK